jgi:hypothetical protein
MADKKTCAEKFPKDKTKRKKCMIQTKSKNSLERASRIQKAKERKSRKKTKAGKVLKKVGKVLSRFDGTWN